MIIAFIEFSPFRTSPGVYRLEGYRFFIFRFHIAFGLSQCKYVRGLVLHCIGFKSIQNQFQWKHKHPAFNHTTLVIVRLSVFLFHFFFCSNSSKFELYEGYWTMDGITFITFKYWHNHLKSVKDFRETAEKYDSKNSEAQWKWKQKHSFVASSVLDDNDKK